MSDLDLYWHEQPEPLTPTTDNDSLLASIEAAIAYEDEQEDEALALRRYRGSARITEAFDRLVQWDQVAGPERVAVVR